MWFAASFIALSLIGALVFTGVYLFLKHIVFAYVWVLLFMAASFVVFKNDPFDGYR